jgi:hypothetical protein
MIEQYLPQTNESATVPKTFQFSELNQAFVTRSLRYYKNFKKFKPGLSDMQVEVVLFESVQSAGPSHHVTVFMIQ